MAALGLATLRLTRGHLAAFWSYTLAVIVCSYGVYGALQVLRVLLLRIFGRRALVVRTEGLSYMGETARVFRLEFANSEIAATVRALNLEPHRDDGEGLPGAALPGNEAEAVDRLVAIYRAHPDGFVASRGGREIEEIRRIGAMLNEQGGMELMLTAHREFSARCGVAGAPRNLEFLWDRVGDWLG